MPKAPARKKTPVVEGRSAKRERLRQELVNAALRQFEARGFDAVTVDDIVEKVDVSRRSFFRYFASKDDLVFSWLDDMGDMIRPVLCQQLAAGNVPLALRNAFLDLAAQLDREPDNPVFLTRLIFGTPALGARYQEEAMRWESEFVRIAQAMLPAPDSDQFQRQVQSSTAIAAWIAALRAWAASNHSSPLAGFVTEAFKTLLDGAKPSRRGTPTRNA